MAEPGAGNLVVTRLDPGDWARWRDLRQEALRESPAAFSAKLADWQGRGDTEHRWRSRLESVPLNLVAQLGGRAAGIVSADAVEEGTVRLLSMWVAPFARGLGVGAALVDAVVRWAREAAAAKVMLDVFDGNVQAERLYLRCGFAFTGVAQQAPGQRVERRMELWLTPGDDARRPGR